MKFFKKMTLLWAALIIMGGTLSSQSAFGITLQEEEELSREFLKVVLAHFEIIDDPLIANYVNEVGNKILSVLPPQPFSYHFYVIKEDVYNAFAIPAGHIFINSGLFEAMESEEELAGILSHEIAHVVCRHISQKIERAQKINIATLAGMAAGVLLGAAGGAGAAANAVTMGSVAAGQSMSLAYSREDERQADQIGLHMERKAGYNGKGLLDVLKKIRSKRWFDSNQIPTYLQTHPGAEERMAYIDTWLEKNKTAAVPMDPYNFQRAHTKLVAVYGDKSTALTQFKSAVEKNPDDPLAHYGYGLILEREGDHKGAVEEIKSALGKRAFDPYILKDLGVIYFNEGQYEQAARILEGAAGINSDDPEILFYLGRTQAELGHLLDAAATFEALIAKNYDYQLVFYFLGETYGKLGKLEDAHYNLGIYYEKKGDLKNAAFHLKKALELMEDPNKRDVIEKMLKDVKEKQKEKAKAGQ
jgi:predicted Zn-dependent protease